MALKEDSQNPFKQMSMIRFFVMSTLFYMTFPVSLMVMYLAVGPLHTKQFLVALFHDFLQTILIFILVMIALIWTITHYLWPIISGVF